MVTNRQFGEIDWSYLEKSLFDGSCDAAADAVSLTNGHGSPLFVYSAKRIRENCRQLLNEFRAIHPNTTIAFASKACALHAVLGIVKSEGLSIEVNSRGELEKARSVGFRDDQIVLNGVAKSKRELETALSPPIKAINVDSLSELDAIAKLSERFGVIGRISLRLAPEIASGTAPGNETASSTTKFGLTQDEFKSALDFLGQANTLKLVGLHVHVGSQVVSTSPYQSAAKFVVEAAQRARTICGVPPEHINLGGGFAIDYAKGRDSSAVPKYLTSTTSATDYATAMLTPIRESLGEDVEIVIEPGRRIVGDSAVMISKVIARKDRNDTKWLYLDAGYHSLIESFTYKWYYDVRTVTRPDDEVSAFRLVGPLCDNGDSFHDIDGEATLAGLLSAFPELTSREADLERMLVRLPRRRHLSADTTISDLVVFQDVGAYSMDQLFAINGRGRPAVVMINDGEIMTVRTADTDIDLSLNEVRSVLEVN